MAKNDSKNERPTPQPGFSKFRPHPWHGVEVGKAPPRLVNAYIEITPFDGVKYEIDKKSGFLKVDRPQLSSSLPPALYGFIPQTFCDARVAALTEKADKGDGDPLDICVFSERPIARADILVPSRVIGAIRMIDRGEADDKIIAVVESDSYYENVRSLKELSPVLLNRLKHYFSTYKLVHGAQPVVIEKTLEADEAEKVVEAAMEDYMDSFGG
jgi:inorganic pyrophosphatase